MKSAIPFYSVLAASFILAGCKTHGDIVVDEGVGITAVRGSCPSVGIPDYTGDITLFTAPGATDAASIDVTAAMTNLRAACNSENNKVTSQVSFDVLARRSDVRGARQVVLPFFISVIRGGNAVIAKRTSTVTINFADGQARAQGHGTGVGYIDKAEATLSNDIRKRITRKRKAGDSDAANDPLTEPDVRSAVARATFDVLAGFQLTDAQVQYNATR